MILYSNALDLVTSDWIASKICDSTSCDILFCLFCCFTFQSTAVVGGGGGGGGGGPVHLTTPFPVQA